MNAKVMESQFLCDSCGTKVSFRETRCPKCGKFFNAVRCPACQFVGENSLFKYGCPVCGYALKVKDQKKQSQKPKKRKLGDPLPAWFYYISLPILLILIIIFSILLLK